jgi:hypothetical protein
MAGSTTGNQTTTGMAGGNQTTTTPAPAGNQTEMAGGAPPAGNATTTVPAPGGNQTTANTTAIETSPEGGQPAAGRKGSKGSEKLNLRHW